MRENFIHWWPPYFWLGGDADGRDPFDLTDLIPKISQIHDTKRVVTILHEDGSEERVALVEPSP